MSLGDLGCEAVLPNRALCGSAVHASGLLVGGMVWVYPVGNVRRECVEQGTLDLEGVQSAVVDVVREVRAAPIRAMPEEPSPEVSITATDVPRDASRCVEHICSDVLRGDERSYEPRAKTEQSGVHAASTDAFQSWRAAFRARLMRSRTRATGRP